jgi:Mrp family chromosome partitioning ATPase
MAGKRSGQIITFYSYQQDTGQTFALANAAWVLASRGKRVLALDWNLESPSLHRYFRAFLVDTDLQTTDGLIDFVWDMALKPMPAERPPDWFADSANFTSYVVSINWPFPRKGMLELIPAGRQSSSYTKLVSSFDWAKFYGDLSGGELIEAAKEKMRQDYDYVLIDSPSGAGAVSGVCTIQLPDKLAVCFTPSVKSIEGAEAMLTSILKQRDDLNVFPVPTRVRMAEMSKLAMVRSYAQKSFDQFLQQFSPAARAQYWSDVEFAEFPAYNSQDALAALSEEPGNPASPRAIVERLCDYLTGNFGRPTATVRGAKRRGGLPKRSRAGAVVDDKRRGASTATGRDLRSAEGKVVPPAKDRPLPVFISYSHHDSRWLDRLQIMLKPMVRNSTLAPWSDTMINTGAKWRREIEKALGAAKVALLLVSPEFLNSDFVINEELPPLFKSAKTSGLIIFWVMLSECLVEETYISEFQAANNPKKPLDSFRRVADQNKELASICRKIKEVRSAGIN